MRSKFPVSYTHLAVEDNEFDKTTVENGLSDNITLEETEDILAKINKCEIEFKNVSFKYPRCV